MNITTILSETYSRRRFLSVPPEPTSEQRATLASNFQHFLNGHLYRNAGSAKVGDFSARNDAQPTSEEIVRASRARCIENARRSHGELLQVIRLYTDRDPQAVVDAINLRASTQGRVTINFRADQFNTEKAASLGTLGNAYQMKQSTGYLNVRSRAEEKMHELLSLAKDSHYGRRMLWLLDGTTRARNPDFSPHAMPNYGSFNLVDEPLPSEVRRYGQSTITLKAGVLDRCFFTADDSFYANAESLCCAQTFASLVLHAHRGDNRQLAAHLVAWGCPDEERPAGAREPRVDYIDTQIFSLGPQDIESIVLSDQEMSQVFQRDPKAMSSFHEDMAVQNRASQRGDGPTIRIG